MYIRFILRTGSHDYGGRGSHDLKAGKPGKPLVIQSVSEDQRTMSASVGGQEKTVVPAQVERANSPFLHILSLFRLSKDWMMPTALGRVPSLLSLQF